MLKLKTVFLVIMLLLSMLVTIGITSGKQKISEYEKSIKPDSIPKLKITIETNKLRYAPGETVYITYTNVGSEVAGFVIGTARPVIPCIIEVKTGRKLFLTDPTFCYPCVMMYGVLEPGDSYTMKWDQQYYGYYGDTFTPSEQVPPGEYYIEMGYWKVTGKYKPPYMVPGGPPEKFEKSEIFDITHLVLSNN